MPPVAAVPGRRPPCSLRPLLLCVVVAGVCASAIGSPSAPPKRPNVIVILADDLGYADLGVQGSPDIPTPHLDALAASGARFTDAYVTCPVCAPSRAALITGRYAQRFGFEDLGGPNPSPLFGLPEKEVTLARQLQGAGYATGMVGKWDLGTREGSRPLEAGFALFFGFLPGANNHLRLADAPGRVNGRQAAVFRNREIVDEPEYLTDAFAREAVGFIERNRAQPFFLYLSFSAPHTPMETPAPYFNRFAHLQGGRRTYAAMVSAMDDAVGRVIAALRAAGVHEETLIFFLSDNGGPSGGSSTTPNFSSNQPLRGYKATFFEGGIRVPFFVSWPARIKAGQVISQPASSLDILPMALAGAKVSPAGQPAPDGTDLLPLLEGHSPALPERPLFWRYFDNYAVRRGDWKMLRIAGQAPQLFNLRADAAETNNLASSQSALVEELSQLISRWDAGLATPKWSRRFVDPSGGETLKPLPLAGEHAVIEAK